MGGNDFVGNIVWAILGGEFVKILLRELQSDQYWLEQGIQEFRLNSLYTDG